MRTQGTLGVGNTAPPFSGTRIPFRTPTGTSAANSRHRLRCP